MVYTPVGKKKTQTLPHKHCLQSIHMFLNLNRPIRCCFDLLRCGIDRLVLCCVSGGMPNVIHERECDINSVVCVAIAISEHAQLTV